MDASTVPAGDKGGVTTHAAGAGPARSTGRARSGAGTPTGGSSGPPVPPEALPKLARGELKELPLLPIRRIGELEERFARG
jgi:hypothetical protein